MAACASLPGPIALLARVSPEQVESLRPAVPDMRAAPDVSGVASAQLDTGVQVWALPLEAEPVTRFVLALPTPHNTCMPEAERAARLAWLAAIRDQDDTGTRWTLNAYVSPQFHLVGDVLGGDAQWANTLQKAWHAKVSDEKLQAQIDLVQESIEGETSASALAWHTFLELHGIAVHQDSARARELSVANVRRCLQRIRSTPGAAVGVAGPIDVSESFERARAHLHPPQAPAQAPARPRTVVETPEGKGDLFLNFAHASENVVAVWLPAPKRYAQDFMAFEVLRKITVSGTFSSLYRELRHDRGLSYWLDDAHVVRGPESGLLVTMGADFNRLEEAFGAIVSALVKPAKAVDRDSLDRARQEAASDLRARLETPRSAAPYLATVAADGRDPRELLLSSWRAMWALDVPGLRAYARRLQKQGPAEYLLVASFDWANYQLGYLMHHARRVRLPVVRVAPAQKQLGWHGPLVHESPREPGILWQHHEAGSPARK